MKITLHLFAGACTFVRKRCNIKQLMALHAGQRFGETLAEIKRKQGKTFSEVAQFMGIGYEMITRYRKMETFSEVVMHKIRALEDWGLNSKHYTDEKEPRWLPEKIEEKSNEEMIREMYDDIQQLNDNLETMAERVKELFPLLIKKLTNIEARLPVDGNEVQE